MPLGLGPLAISERSDAESSRVASASAPKAPIVAAAPKPSADPDPAKDTESSADENADSDAEEETTKSADTVAAPDAPPAKFAGLYAGHDIAIFRLPGEPEREERDDKAKIRIEEAAGDNVRIVLVNSTDGTDLCTLVARVEGNSALVESAQPCFGSEGEGGLQAELRSGRAVLDGDSLTMDAEGSIGDQDLDGELSYTFQGQRQ